MATIETLAEELQKTMALRYDKEFNEMRFFIDGAYEHGLADGKAQAKAEIINLINGGKHENKSDI
jgi:hypothetical protein